VSVTLHPWVATSSGRDVAGLAALEGAVWRESMWRAQGAADGQGSASRNSGVLVGPCAARGSRRELQNLLIAAGLCATQVPGSSRKARGRFRSHRVGRARPAGRRVCRQTWAVAEGLRAWRVEGGRSRLCLQRWQRARPVGGAVSVCGQGAGSAARRWQHRGVLARKGDPGGAVRGVASSRRRPSGISAASSPEQALR